MREIWYKGQKLDLMRKFIIKKNTAKIPELTEEEARKIFIEAELELKKDFYIVTFEAHHSASEHALEMMTITFFPKHRETYEIEPIKITDMPTKTPQDIRTIIRIHDPIFKYLTPVSDEWYTFLELEHEILSIAKEYGFDTLTQKQIREINT